MYHLMQKLVVLRSSHIAFVSSVWFSEQRAIISLHIIKRFVFITETVIVHRAVRTVCLNITQVNFSLWLVNTDNFDLNFIFIRRHVLFLSKGNFKQNILWYSRYFL
jgi:hypothetical protein